MARTRTTRRTYNKGNPQQTVSGNIPRQAESALVEEPVQDVAAAGLSEMATDKTPNKEEDLQTVCQDSPSVQCEGVFVASEVGENLKGCEKTCTMSPKPQENGISKQDDSLELKSPIIGSSQDNASNSQCQPSAAQTDVDPPNNSCDSPLNLTWDSSLKESCQPQTNAPNFRPVTPDFLNVPVDDIFSPTTQKAIRTTIRALFPNGPPPPPRVRPVRRPKKGDEAYIVGCDKRPRVPSPRSLSVFRGDQYGITKNTNCDEDEEQCSPAKRGKLGPRSGMSISKSRFNPQSNEIAERLKLYEKIDRLLGRTPKEEPVGYMTGAQTTKRSFSPLPSTSTDNETIMKNDKHFSESLNCDNFDINDDEDEELPEVFLDSSNIKQEKCTRENSPLTINKDTDEDKKPSDNILEEMNENINNNNNDVISIDDDSCEIQFDKYLPKEKLLDYSDMEPKKEPEVSDSIVLKDDSRPTRVMSPTTPTDVICVEDAFNHGIANNGNKWNPISTQTSVLRASNRIASATETRQSDLVSEVPDVLEPSNISCQASTSRLPVWNEDVQFVSEVKSNLPNQNRENISDVQFISESPSSSQSTIRVPAELSLQLLIDLESYARRKSRKKSKRQKSKDNTCVPIVNNENAAPSVNQTQMDSNMSQPAPPTSPGKRLGVCPICLDSFPMGSIASTNCGHVFCLDCIKQSLKTSGKRCPTCRKQLKGVGYHQVFL